MGRRSAKGGKCLSKGKEDNAGKGKGNNMSADNVQDEEAWAAAVTAATVAWNQAAWDQRHRASPFVIDSNMQSPEDCYAAGVARGFALATGGVAGGGKGVGKTSDMGGSRSSGQQWAAGGGAGGGKGAGLPPMPCGVSPTPDQQWWPCHFWEQRELDEQGGTCHGWAITSHKGSKKTRWVCARCARLLAAQRQFSQDGGSPGGGDHFGPGGSPGGGDHFGPGGSGPGNGFGSDQYWLNRLPVVEARLTR